MDSFGKIIALFLAAILMVVFPLVTMADRTDDVSKEAVQTATTQFTDKVRTSGTITLDDYEQYMQTIHATGNTFEPEILILQLDENPGVKVTQAEVTKIGESLYYNKYTSQVEKELDENGRMKLKQGDRIYVSVKNTNKTIAQLLRNFFYQITGNESAQITAKDGGIVHVNGSTN